MLNCQAGLVSAQAATRAPTFPTRRIGDISVSAMAKRGRLEKPIGHSGFPGQGQYVCLKLMTMKVSLARTMLR